MKMSARRAEWSYVGTIEPATLRRHQAQLQPIQNVVGATHVGSISIGCISSRAGQHKQRVIGQIMVLVKNGELTVETVYITVAATRQGTVATSEFDEFIHL